MVTTWKQIFFFSTFAGAFSSYALDRIDLEKIIVNVVAPLENANHWLHLCQTVKAGCDLQTYIIVVYLNVHTRLQMFGVKSCKHKRQIWTNLCVSSNITGWKVRVLCSKISTLQTNSQFHDRLTVRLFKQDFVRLSRWLTPRPPPPHPSLSYEIEQRICV